MSTIVACIGTENTLCTQEFEKKSGSHKRCKSCAKAVMNTAHKDWESSHPEWASVRNHYSFIFKEQYRQHKNYKDMPFFDGWNPAKGGSFMAGAEWIIFNLGRRPEGCSLHVIHHDLGFVPGNLEWTHRKKQSNQQMFKIIAQQRHRIEELEKEVEGLKEKLACQTKFQEKP